MICLLFILFIAIIVRALTLDGAFAGVEFFLKDFSKLTADTILYAMGQSFFSLTVGASVMVTYSSYLKKEEHLAKSATSIVSLTVFVTVLAGLAIFPAIFALGVKPTEGWDYCLSSFQQYLQKYHLVNFLYYVFNFILLCDFNISNFNA